MRKKLKQVWGRHQVRYLVVAGSTSLGYLTLVWLGLHLGLHYMLAILLAQAITIGIAFPLYRSLVFQSTGAVIPDFVRFLSVWASGAVAGVLATPFLVEVFSWDPLIAQILSILVIAVVSFLSHQFFTFRRNRLSSNH
ncbi:GtrA family protein [Demequina aurantiaca]|uniref:GtrA family protein n=1 Tax=Demequina aurantiaca TaxID=676200 RepID=UPI00078566E3|nr:GtrA family protein [Demequina aurantiaca]